MFIYKRCSCSPKTSLRKKGYFSSSNLSDLLKLVSVPTRLEILLLLEGKPHCVCDIQTHTKLSQSLISHHLSDLTKAGFIESDKEGKFVEYKLTDKGQKLIKNLNMISN